MPRFRDQAVCLRLIDWSETSQVVALFTREHGKLRGLAKGAKRMSPGAIQRFSGGIELLTRGEVLATTKPTTELAAITEWDLQAPHHHLRTNLHAHSTALYAADLTHAMLADHDPHPDLFDALAVLLAELADLDETARATALARYQWRLMADTGFGPTIDRDAHSNQPLIDAPTWFDARAGGLTHRGPRTKTGSSRGLNSAGPWRVRPETIAGLHWLAAVETPGDKPTHPHTDAAAAHTPQVDVLQRVNRLLCVYARAILDRQLPTMPFILRENA